MLTRTPELYGQDVSILAAWKLIEFITRPQWQFLHDYVYGSSPVQEAEFEFIPEQDAWIWEPQMEQAKYGVIPPLMERWDVFVDELDKNALAVVLGQILPEVAIRNVVTRYKEAM